MVSSVNVERFKSSWFFVYWFLKLTMEERTRDNMWDFTVRRITHTLLFSNILPIS
jgi:hypothetical protein